MSGWLLGLALGVRHAIEPDHLTAVSTLVVEQRSPGLGAWLGVCWGLGHATALLVVAGALAVLDARLSPVLADAFELGVAVMLVALGLRSVRRALSRGQPATERAHRLGGASHTHWAAPGHLPPGPRPLAARSLVVGMVHGLAGSGALTALVLAGLPSARSRLGYLLAFGLGSMVGMALVSGAAGWPLARVSRHPRLARGVVLATGTWSAGLGLAWGAPLAERLLG